MIDKNDYEQYDIEDGDYYEHAFDDSDQYYDHYLYDHHYDLFDDEDVEVEDEN